jgi:hypothetical protein
MTLSIDLLRKLLKERGTVSAYDGARILMCRPEEFCAMARDDWWSTEQIPGPEGWLYRPRASLSARATIQKSVKEYADSSQIGRTGFGRQSREVSK